MATRSASIASGAQVNITDALNLEEGTGYLLELGPEATGMDTVFVALGGDPAAEGGHSIFASEPGRFIRQSASPWFARFYAIDGRSTQLTVTEADDCN